MDYDYDWLIHEIFVLLYELFIPLLTNESYIKRLIVLTANYV